MLPSYSNCESPHNHLILLSIRLRDLILTFDFRGSLAGITALPTDPAALLKLGPAANSLASALPTPSVLSVLLTAAPSGFVSSVVNDKSYANSFQSAFAAGSSPSWFNSLPTGVKSYLHTYSGFGGLATAAGEIRGQASSVGAEATGASSKLASGASGATATEGSSATATMDSSATAGSTSGTAIMSDTSASSTEGSTPSSGAAVAAGSSGSPQSGAASRNGGFAAGLVGVIGILGIAIAL